MHSKAAPVKDAGRPMTLRSVADAQIPDGTILAVHGCLPGPERLDVAPGGDFRREGEALGSEETRRQQALRRQGRDGRRDHHDPGAEQPRYKLSYRVPRSVGIRLGVFSSSLGLL